MRWCLLLVVLHIGLAVKVILDISTALEGLVNSRAVSDNEFYFLVYRHRTPAALFTFHSRN